MSSEHKKHRITTLKLEKWGSFNIYLQLPTSELFWEIRCEISLLPEENSFLINLRRLCSSDFLMR